MRVAASPESRPPVSQTVSGKSPSKVPHRRERLGIMRQAAAISSKVEKISGTEGNRQGTERKEV